MDKLYLEKLISENPKSGIRKLATIANVSFTTIRYWLKKYDLKSEGERESKFDWSKEKIKESIIHSKCKSDILKYLGVSLGTTHYQKLDLLLKKYNIDTSNFEYDYKRGHKFTEKYDDELVFTKNSPLSNKNIKRRIIKNSLLDYECVECGITDSWNGKKITLQLDHIDGDNNNNKLENLRFLCPNCHSQTETHSVKKSDVFTELGRLNGRVDNGG
jgi:Zn finger protein HypA/HybF involved in hydrogenase expression